MAKYRKKPVVIEAIQWFRMGDHPKVSLWKDGTGWIKTLEGGHIVSDSRHWRYMLFDPGYATPTRHWRRWRMRRNLILPQPAGLGP